MSQEQHKILFGIDLTGALGELKQFILTLMTFDLKPEIKIKLLVSSMRRLGKPFLAALLNQIKNPFFKMILSGALATNVVEDVVTNALVTIAEWAYQAVNAIVKFKVLGVFIFDWRKKFDSKEDYKAAKAQVAREILDTLPNSARSASAKILSAGIVAHPDLHVHTEPDQLGELEDVQKSLELAAELDTAGRKILEDHRIYLENYVMQNSSQWATPQDAENWLQEQLKKDADDLGLAE